MSMTLGNMARLSALIVLAALTAACGVRGNLVPPNQKDVLVETSDSTNKSDDDARFPTPEPVEEN